MYFWLFLDEIQSTLDEPKQISDATRQVAERKAQNRFLEQGGRALYTALGSKPAFWWKWVFPTPELNQSPMRTLWWDWASVLVK